MVGASRKTFILIVDNTPEDVDVLCRTLESDYRIRVASDGSEALEIAHSENPPDLILMDIAIPDISGFKVCSRLKRSKKTKNIPVIFITAASNESDETKGFKIGAVDYIAKPFSPPIVKARVKLHLELKHNRDILENLSTIDALTGIANRRRFDEYYNAEWKRSVREKTALSLIMIDIDFFKPYNDNYGDSAGDECLKQVAKCLFDLVRRPADLLAQYGGEEFVCILPKTALKGAVQIGDIMRRSIERLKIVHEHSSISGFVTVSLGTATVLPANKLGSERLINEADKCLYKAKAEGRNRLKSIDLTKW